MRVKRSSEPPKMFFGGRAKKRRKEGKGFFGNSQARFSDMAGAGDGIDMSYRGKGFLGIGKGKGSALRKEKRQLKRAARRGELGEGGQDRLDYLKSVQKDRAKKAIGAGALAAGAAFGGAALAGKLGAKAAATGGKGLFKAGAKAGTKEGGKGFFKKFGKNLLKNTLKNAGNSGGQQDVSYQQPVQTPYQAPGQTSSQGGGTSIAYNPNYGYRTGSNGVRIRKRNGRY